MLHWEDLSKWESAIKVAIDLGGAKNMVIKAPEQCSIRTLWLLPEAGEGLLISQAIDVESCLAHGFQRNAMEEGLKAHGAVN